MDQNSKTKNAGNVAINFGVSGMPLSLFKSFTADMNEYKGLYWVKIGDLMRKAEAYDTFVAMGFIERQQEEIGTGDVEMATEEPKEVLTLGGIKDE